MVDKIFNYQRKQKRKITIGTIVLMAVILIIMAWVIIAAIGSNNKSPRRTPGQPAVTSQAEDGNTAVSTSKAASKSSQAPTATSPVTSTDLPVSGPTTNFTAAALLIGTATYLALLNHSLIKQRHQFSK